MKTIKDLDVAGKRVLVRVDFNIDQDKEGRIGDPFRVEAVKPTLQYLADKKAKIILLSHWGRPTHYDLSWSLIHVVPYLENVIGKKVQFCGQLFGEIAKRKVDELYPGEVMMLENLRFDSREAENNMDFAHELARLGDIFVEEAFGVIHREHASLVTLPKILPSGAGFLVEKELKFLGSVESSKRPLTVIIGGAKATTKVQFLKNFLEKADHVILGGVIANTVLAAKGMSIGKSIVGAEDFEDIKQLNLTSTKLHLPIDVLTSCDTQAIGKCPINIKGAGNIAQDELILDIGPDSQKLFSNIIKTSGTVVWNGPMGLCEVQGFSGGTEAIAQTIADNKIYSIVGGGDTASFLHRNNFFDKMSHVSTGGASMLEFLSGKELPGLKVLES